MHLKLSLLGQYRAEIDQKVIPISRAKKIEALLIYLAVEMDLPHTRLALDGLLFPELPAAGARTNLRQTLTRLRRSLRDDRADLPFLLVEEETLQFNPGADYTIDLHTFRKHLQGCSQHQTQRAGDCQACLYAVETAARCYRGPFLDGFFIEESVAFEEWLARVRERVHDEAQWAYGWLADRYERAGDYELADAYAQRCLDLEPWNEEAHRQRMRLLARRGQRSAALAQYKRCRELLAAELGVEPSPTTKALLDRIRHVAPTRPHNLPQPAGTSFIGRSALIGQIRNMLIDSERRLITLTGAGGIGKTQLALHVANELVEDYIGPFMHGIYFVTFANNDAIVPADVAPISVAVCINALTQALALSLTGTQTPKIQLVDALRSRECLLLFDNCELLQEEACSLFAAILHSCRDVTILATSRTRLQLPEEWVVEVPGLAYPIEQITEQYRGQSPVIDEDFLAYPAVQLFVQRAQQADHTFDPAVHIVDEQHAIIHISRLTQGMPLALELAAAWVHLLSCRQIADALQTALELPATTELTRPQRHQSLRIVFAYSWQLLSSTEQKTLAALTIFRGSFGLNAAIQITGASFFSLAQLVNHSLLYSIRGGSEMRYWLHPLLRQFAAEKLVDNGNMYRTDHAQLYGQWLAEQHDSLHGAELVATLHGIEADIENIRAGWQWAVAQRQVTLLGRYMPSLYVFYALRGWRHEGRELFAQAVALAEGIVQPEVLPPDQALIFSGLISRLAGFQYELGQIDEAERLMHQGITFGHLAEEPDDLALTYKRLGQVAYQRGDYAQAIRFLQFTLQILQETQARLEIAHTFMTLGAIARDQTDYQQAQDFFQQSVAIYRQESYIWGLAHALRLLMTTTYHIDGIERAKPFQQESMALAQQLQSRDVEALTMQNWGQIMQHERCYEDAATLYHTALTHFQTMEHDRGRTLCFESLGRLMAEKGLLTDAKSFYTQSFYIALTLQDTPLLLRIVAGIAKLAIQIQQTQQPISPETPSDPIMALLDLLYSHPGSPLGLQQEAAQLLTRITTTPNDKTIDKAIEQAPRKVQAPALHEIERVVTSVLVI